MLLYADTHGCEELKGSGKYGWLLVPHQAVVVNNAIVHCPLSRFFEYPWIWYQLKKSKNNPVALLLWSVRSSLLQDYNSILNSPRETRVYNSHWNVDSVTLTFV
jgi:hypothetical protein